MLYAGWIARLMLVIALLPWGAYHGASRGPSLKAAVSTVEGIMAIASLQPIAQPGKPAALSSQPRRCKTGVLHGTSCAPDAMLARAAPLISPPHNGPDLIAQTRGLDAALPEAPPRRPPRAA